MKTTRQQRCLIYGAYGYTGNLIAEMAKQQGLQPILAGKDEAKLREQASRLALPYRAFDLSDPHRIQAALEDVCVVLHCAGPFIHTYQAMVTACLAVGTHYVDITGEYQVISALMQMNTQALKMGIMLLPGAGFDVVPSDCLAAQLKSRLPDANRLLLAIHARGDSQGASVSRGTAKTAAMGILGDPLIREDAVLKSIPFAAQEKLIDFGGPHPITCMHVSWGDLASAWWSTGIPHIETLMSLPVQRLRRLRYLRAALALLPASWVSKGLNYFINQRPAGPSEAARRQTSACIYGEVSNARGEHVAARLEMPNGYLLTAQTALLIVTKILNGHVPTGFQTPSTAYGAGLILEVPGVTLTFVDVP